MIPRPLSLTRLPLLALSATLMIGDAMAGEVMDKEAFGRALFFDVDLSLNRTQSCATCHNPETGFADPRDNEVAGAASLGDDGVSLGDRNAPTASYAAFSPVFRITRDGKAVGGQFHDGRAADLQAQAAGPPLASGEMAMPGKAAVLERLLEKPEYVASLRALYGQGALEEAETAYDAMTDAIAAFEETDFFSPFDSKYDRWLAGSYKMTPMEELGRVLFFSQQFTNCNICHQLKARPGAEGETFSNYEYHNIGVPVNAALRRANGVALTHKDIGLAANGRETDKGASAGKFKTPTLRNVAVTAPYMHNGVFADLKTVVAFYNSYNSKSEAARINPETGALWGSPEVADTLSMQELTEGPALDNKRMDALVAFMETLTDRRYEYLLED